MKMMNRLVALARQPKKRPSRKQLMLGLGFQGILLGVVLIVVVFFPESAPALASLVLLAIGFTMSLFLEAHEGRLGEPDGAEVAASQRASE